MTLADPPAELKLTDKIRHQKVVKQTIVPNTANPLESLIQMQQIMTMGMMMPMLQVFAGNGQLPGPQALSAFGSMLTPSTPVTPVTPAQSTSHSQNDLLSLSTLTHKCPIMADYPDVDIWLAALDSDPV